MGCTAGLVAGLACTACNTRPLSAGTAESSPATETGASSSEPDDYPPLPPDVGAGAVLCGAPGGYAATVEDVAALQGCERSLGSVVLTFVGDDPSVVSNLVALRVVDETLTSVSNPELLTLEGLDSLEWVGSVGLSQGYFVSLTALARLEGTDDVFQIYAQRDLTNLRGLDALRTVGGNLFITVNYELTSVDGLGSLEWIGGDLLLEGNPKLASLAGLSALRRVDGDVTIVLNDQLPAAEIDSFLARIQVGGDVFLDD